MVGKIKAKGFPSSIPKILVVMTDGHSQDNVKIPSDYARSLGITLIAVGIGDKVDNSQLLEIA